jgi:hypothetical protein
MALSPQASRVTMIRVSGSNTFSATSYISQPIDLQRQLGLFPTTSHHFWSSPQERSATVAMGEVLGVPRPGATRNQFDENLLNSVIAQRLELFLYRAPSSAAVCARKAKPYQLHNSPGPTFNSFLRGPLLNVCEKRFWNANRHCWISPGCRAPSSFLVHLN